VADEADTEEEETAGASKKARAKHPHKKKTKHPRKRKGRKPKKAKKPKKFHAPRGHVGTSHGRGSVYKAGHAGSGEVLRDVAVPGVHSTGAHHAGLGGVVLELVGEGSVSLGAALSAWQREIDRVTNSAWRRPGGLARMGGL
jgi:hypothetical protein